MADFPGPNKEEAIESMMEQTSKEVDIKSATVVVVGISPNEEDGVVQDGEKGYGVFYSVAGFKYFTPTGKVAPSRNNIINFQPEIVESYPGKFTWTDYRGDTVRDDEGNVLPHQSQERMERLYDIPWEAFREYREGDEESVNNPEMDRRLAPGWYRAPGRSLIYRQPTGLHYFESLHGSPQEAIVQLTVKVRNAFSVIHFSQEFEGKEHGIHLDEKIFRPEAWQRIHEMITQRLAGLSTQTLRRFAIGEDLEGGFQEVAVFVLDPIGFNSIYFSVDEALAAIADTIEEDATAQPLQLAASLDDKDFAKVLVRIAESLDSKNAVEEARVADQLLNSIFTMNKSSDN